MEFRFHDVFSKIIPGGFLLSASLILLLPFVIANEQLMKYANLLKEFDGLLTALTLILVYVLGYIIDGIGSMITEPLLWFFWRGWPIELLHQNRNTKRTTFPQSKLVFSNLSEDYFKKSKEKFTKNEYDLIYYHAQSILRKEGSEKQIERQEQYLEAYIFSRNILTSIALSLAILLLLQFSGIGVGYIYILSIHLAILLFFYFRCKDKSLYQTRDLLNSASSLIKNNLKK